MNVHGTAKPVACGSRLGRCLQSPGLAMVMFLHDAWSISSRRGRLCTHVHPRSGSSIVARWSRLAAVNTKPLQKRGRGQNLQVLETVNMVQFGVFLAQLVQCWLWPGRW